MNTLLQKKGIIVLYLSGLVFPAKAQIPFNVVDSLDVNNIKTWQLVHGDMWYDPSTNSPRCEYPKGSGKHIGFSGALWFAGYDNNSFLGVAAQTYRTDGVDYWPGPLENSTIIDYTESEKWARIWKLNRWELESFLNTSVHTTANTPATILEWPAKGNTYAKGYNGASLTLLNRQYAPFVDANSDGIYNSLDGDYPAMKGDQMTWFIYNDNSLFHTVSNGIPLMLEVSCMAYAYKRNSTIDNVIFYEYSITSRNPFPIDSFVIGTFADVDLGYGFDDYCGYDSTRNLGIVYNGDPLDGTGTGSGEYHDSIPKAGITVLQFPGDTCGNVSSAGSFLFFNNGNSVPNYDSQFNHLLRARWIDGAHLKDYPNNNDINYLFPDDPSIPGGWSECAGGYPPNDVRMVLSSKPFQLASGATFNYAFALVASPQALNNSCPGTTFADIRIVSDTAQKVFCNPLPDVSAVRDIRPGKLSLYPNPATNTLNIACHPDDVCLVKVLDITGRDIHINTTTSDKGITIDVAHLANGVYQLLLTSKATVQSARFVKQ